MALDNADLDRLGDRLTKTIEREVGLVRTEFAKDIRGVYHRIDELKRQQETQNSRVNEHGAAIAEMRGEQQAQCERIESCEADVADHSSELARVDERAKLADERSKTVDTRTRNVQPTLGITLTKSQKSMLASAGIAVLGLLADAVRHGVAFIIAYLQTPRHQ